MNIIKRLILYTAASLLVFVPNTLFGEVVTITAVGEYIMGDNDTYTEAKKLALQDAKRVLLEKVGTYIESKTVVKDNVLNSDEIKQYSAGIVKVEEIGEERSVLGKATVVKVNVKALLDPDDLIKQVLSFRNRKDVEESVKKLSDDNSKLRKEIEQLNQQLRNVVDESKYRQLRAQREEILTKIDASEKGLILILSGEGLYTMALLDRQKTEEGKKAVIRFMKEIASAYRLSASTPEVNDNGDGTANVSFKVTARLESKSARLPYHHHKLTEIPNVNLTEFLSTGLHINYGGIVHYGNCGHSGGPDCLTISCDKRKCEEIIKFMDSKIKSLALLVKLGKFEKKQSLYSQLLGTMRLIPACVVCTNLEKRYDIKLPLSELKSLSQLELKIVYDSQEYGQSEEPPNK